MQTLTYGFKKPQTGDQGTALFTALADNITRLDAHDHDGVDSPRLTSAAINKVTQTIAAGSWVATSQGNYRQVVTLPGTLLYSEISIAMKNSSGHYVSATIEAINATTYYVYSNNVSEAFTAVYS